MDNWLYNGFGGILLLLLMLFSLVWTPIDYKISNFIDNVSIPKNNSKQFIVSKNSYLDAEPDEWEGEYDRVGADNTNGVLWKFGKASHTLYKYSLSNNLVKEIKIDPSVTDLCAASDKYLVLYMSNKDSVLLFDVNSEETKWVVEDSTNLGCTYLTISSSSIISSVTYDKDGKARFSRLAISDGSSQVIDIPASYRISHSSRVHEANNIFYFFDTILVVRDNGYYDSKDHLYGISSSGKVVFHQSDSYEGELVVNNGIIYFSQTINNKKFVVAFNVVLNKEIWRQRVNDRKSYLGVQGDTLIYGGGGVSTFDLTTGKKRWSTNISHNNIYRPPKVSIIGDKIGILYAVNKSLSVVGFGLLPEEAYYFKLLNNKGKVIFMMDNVSILTADSNTIYVIDKDNFVYGIR